MMGGADGGEGGSAASGGTLAQPSFEGVDADAPQMAQLEQLLCLVEVQRQDAERRAHRAQAAAQEREECLTIELMRMRSELDAALESRAAAEQQTEAALRESEELHQALAQLEQSQHALQLRVAHVSKKAPGRGDQGDASDSLESCTGPAGTAGGGHGGRGVSRGDAAHSELQKQRLLEVIESSSLVFAEIQNKMYDLQHELGVARQEADALKAERVVLKQRLEQLQGAELEARDAAAEIRSSRVLNIIEAEKYARVFLHCQFDVFSFQQWAVHQRALHRQVEHEAAVRSNELQRSAKLMEAHFEHDIQRAAELAERLLRDATEAHKRELQESSEKLQSDVHNLKIDNDLLQENVEEWRRQFNESMRQRDSELAELRHETARELQEAQHSASLKAAECAAALEAKAAMKERVARLEEECSGLREELEEARGRVVALNDALSVSQRASSSAAVVSSPAPSPSPTKANSGNAAAAAAVAPVNGPPENSGGGAAIALSAVGAAAATAAPPPFMVAGTTTTMTKTVSSAAGLGNDGDIRGGGGELRGVRFANAPSAASWDALRAPPSAQSAAADASAAAAELRELQERIAEMEQLVVAVEREKLLLKARFDAEVQQLRYLADAAERTKAQSVMAQTQQAEELEVLRVQNAKLQRTLSSVEQLLQAKERELDDALAKQRKIQARLEDTSRSVVAAQTETRARLASLEESHAEVCATLQGERQHHAATVAALEACVGECRAAQARALLLEERACRKELAHQADLYFAQRSRSSS